MEGMLVVIRFNVKHWQLLEVNGKPIFQYSLVERVEESYSITEVSLKRLSSLPSI
jgi:hypothetical protein